MQIEEMSLRETPSRTVVEPRVSASCCCPTCIGTWKAEAPAGALKLWTFPPESMMTVPGAVSKATTKTESSISSQPFGRPSK
jgi:hypothetical protein